MEDNLDEMLLAAFGAMPAEDNIDELIFWLRTATTRSELRAIFRAMLSKLSDRDRDRFYYAAGFLARSLPDDGASSHDGTIGPKRKWN
jgi:hypothetical protein